MPSTFDPTQTYSGTGSTTPATTTAPGTTQSTATQGSTTKPATLSAQQQAQFESAFGINSTDIPAYINGSQLTELGQALQWYGSLDQSDRQQAQMTLVALGYLTEADATGEASSTDLSAFKAMLGQGKLSDFQTALSDPTTAVQAQISTNLATAAKEQSAAQQPIVASLTDTNSANQTLSKAFEDALGYQPSADQMNTFVQSLHAAQESQAAGERDAEQQAASEETAQSKVQEDALQKLGPDGLDSFLSAYSNAIHGLGQSNAVNGTVAAPGSVNPNPAGILNGPMGAPTTSTTQVGRSGLGALAGMFIPGMGITHSVTSTTQPAATTVNQPIATSGSKGSVPARGGIYALSPSLWQQAQQLYPAAAKYTTAGSAPQTIQTGAVGALAQHLFDTNGNSWSDVAISLAGGNPSNPTAGHVANTSTNLQTFATGIANNVNSQIAALQNEANTQAAPVVGKEAPNPEADALAAAESADPDQYIAHNMSLVEGTVQKMLYGTPQIEAQSTSNLAGDVAQVAASNSAAT